MLGGVGVVVRWEKVTKQGVRLMIMINSTNTCVGEYCKVLLVYYPGYTDRGCADLALPSHTSFFVQDNILFVGTYLCMLLLSTLI